MRDKKESRRWWVFVILAVLAAGFFMVDLSPKESGPRTQPTTTISEGKSHAGNVTVELYHFHRTRQCYSCKTVGALAEKTANTYFRDELNSSRLIFAHVNIDLPENRELVMRYGATGSSLWIGTYSDGAFHRKENTDVWYKINNEQDYLKYLKGILEKRLSGDLS